MNKEAETKAKEATWEACLMSSSQPCKGGFKTEDEAWDYVHDRSCDICKANPEHDACAAEWMVFEEEVKQIITDKY